MGCFAIYHPDVSDLHPRQRKENHRTPATDSPTHDASVTQYLGAIDRACPPGVIYWERLAFQ